MEQQRVRTDCGSLCVTSAALILGLAFVALSASPGTEVKIFATALAAGILIDATIVRAILVPAAMAISGAGTGGCRSGPRGCCASSLRCSGASRLPRSLGRAARNGDPRERAEPRGGSVGSAM
jgi:MMPL family